MQIQKFGIELRTIGNVESLYKEVDTVLGKVDSNNGLVGSRAKVQTVAHSLQKMFQTKSHFSVCTIRECSELCQICISKERMSLYNSIHCMHWNEMLPDYRQMVVAMVMDDFRTVLTE